MINLVALNKAENIVMFQLSPDSPMDFIRQLAKFGDNAALCKLTPENSLANLTYQFRKTLGDEFSVINGSLKDGKLCFIDDGSHKYNIIFDAATVRQVDSIHSVEEFRVMLEPIDQSCEFSQIKCSDNITKIHTIRFGDNSLYKSYVLLQNRLYAQNIEGEYSNIDIVINLDESMLQIAIGTHMTEEQFKRSCKHKSDSGKLYLCPNDEPYPRYDDGNMMRCSECSLVFNVDSYTSDEINDAIQLLTTVIHQIKFITNAAADDNAVLQRLSRNISEFKNLALFYNNTTRKFMEK